MTLLLVLFLAGAAPPTETRVSDLVRRLQQRYEETEDFAADVVQKSVFRSLGRTLEARGRVYFKRPGRLRWEVENATRELIVADGTYLWIYHPDRKQAYKAPFDRAFRSRTPVSFLLGLGRISEEFHVTDAGSDGTALRLRLEPRSATELGVLELTVDAATLDVRKARIEDPLGNVTELEFRNFRRDLALEDSLFLFEPPEGTEVLVAPGLL
ncbi:MAG: hypothetical protein KatS3mg076_2686 [Candidatus Binatia bacterium]|nr:MAG: hypothetical protein KatS3mg076_2686 [Candidatus Binatia bacterium]